MHNAVCNFAEIVCSFSVAFGIEMWSLSDGSFRYKDKSDLAEVILYEK
jgi:hypothetical protein